MNDITDTDRTTPGRLITSDDIRYHVQRMTVPGQYDVDAIVEEIIRKLGRIDLYDSEAMNGSLGDQVWEIIWENERPAVEPESPFEPDGEGGIQYKPDPYITPDLFRPDDDAGALDRAVLRFAARVHAEGGSEDAVQITSLMAEIREMVRNPQPQGREDGVGLAEQLRELGGAAYSLAALIGVLAPRRTDA